jgi:N-acetylglucosamine kinase-like BadF-type ATPase
MLYLGIDAGATATKWSLHDGATTIISGKSLAMDGHIYRPESRLRMHQVLKDISSQIDEARVIAIYAGLTGLAQLADDQEEIKGIFRDYFPIAQCTLVLDIELAYRAYFNPGEGIILYAGTGSIAMHITESGEVIRSGGWGYLLGDEGAGFWIGREALRHVALQLELKEIDPFTEELCKKLGIAAWGDIRTIVYGSERSAVAAISEIIADLAAQGDLVAMKILSLAADYLCDLITRIDHFVTGDKLPVAFSGGIASGIPMIFERLHNIVGERISLGSKDVAVAASLLAQH